MRRASRATSSSARSTTRVRSLSVSKRSTTATCERVPVIAIRDATEQQSCSDAMSISLGLSHAIARIITSAEEKSAMLVWEEDRTTENVHAASTAQRASLRLAVWPSRRRRRSRRAALASQRGRAGRRGSPPQSPTARRVKAADKRIINGRDRRQPAGAVQVQVGVGEVPRHLRQPLDAAGSEHVARHRDLEGSERPDRRRAPHRQAQPRLLRHRRFAGRQQHRARHLPPHHGARVPPVPAAPGVRGGDPHPRLPVHRRVARPRRERDLQRLPRGRSRSATRTSS